MCMNNSFTKVHVKNLVKINNEALFWLDMQAVIASLGLTGKYTPNNQVLYTDEPVLFYWFFKCTLHIFHTEL